MTRLLLLVIALAGCGGERQADYEELYSVEGIAGDLTPLPDSDYTARIDVGSDPLSVPLDISWTAARDSTGCLRVASLTIVRAGGDNVRVSDVKHAAVECGMRMESEDTTRFETLIISMSYTGRVAGKRHEFSGSAASIQGDGEAASLR